jgi:UDP-glucose 4-epimerase
VQGKAVSYVLVTGGSGFLGRHVVAGLRDARHRIRVLDRLSPSRDLTAQKCAAVDVIVADLADRDVLERALAGVEVVVHLACTTVPQSSEAERIYDVRSNIESTLLLLECAVEAGVRRFIFASSGGTVYGEPTKLPIPEDHPTEPICSHGVMKLAIENYLRVFHRLTGLETIALRMSNPYGPGQGIKPQGFIGVLARCLNEGRPIELWGDGSVVRDFLHVTDAAAAFERVVAGCGLPGAYNIGSARGRTLIEVIAEVERIIGRPVPLRRVSGRAIDIAANILDNAKARTELGWEPRVSFEEGLRGLFGTG